MLDLILSVMMLASGALGFGAYHLYRRGETRRATLMAVLACVMLANVAIWIVPGADGTAPGDLADPATP